MNNIRYIYGKPIAIIIGLLVVMVTVYGRYQKWIERYKKELDEVAKIVPSPSAIELKQIFSFPSNKQEEDDQYLWSPHSMARDMQGNYYISDTKAHCIIVYDSNGKFKLKFGRQGQGPGDLRMPMGIWVMGDEVIVVEPGNRRLQWLDLSGKYIKSIRMFKTYQALSILNNGDLVVSPAYVGKKDKNMLIEIQSSEGKIIRRFGTPMEFKNEQDILNERSMFVNESHEIIQVFKQIPLLQAYSMDGKLLREKILDTGYSLKYEQINRKKSYHSSDESVGYMTIFEEAACLGDMVYILGKNGDYLWIWAVDKEFNIIKTYWNKTGKDYLIWDFLPFIEEGKLKFAILGSQIEAKITVFAQ